MIDWLIADGAFYYLDRDHVAGRCPCCGAVLAVQFVGSSTEVDLYCHGGCDALDVAASLGKRDRDAGSRGSVPFGRGLPRSSRARSNCSLLTRGGRTPELLQAWLTLAFRPPEGYRADTFERHGRQRTDPCTLTFRNGRDSIEFRFMAQGDLAGAKLRATVLAASDGELDMPHLTDSEKEDVWAALYKLGRVMTDVDDRDETRKWCQQMIDVSSPLRGYTLVPDGRHDALMAMRNLGEFTRPDALAIARPSWEKYEVSPAHHVRPGNVLPHNSLTLHPRDTNRTDPLRWMHLSYRIPDDTLYSGTLSHASMRSDSRSGSDSCHPPIRSSDCRRLTSRRNNLSPRYDDVRYDDVHARG